MTNALYTKMERKYYKMLLLINIILHQSHTGQKGERKNDVDWICSSMDQHGSSSNCRSLLYGIRMVFVGVITSDVYQSGK